MSQAAFSRVILIALMLFLIAVDQWSKGYMMALVSTHGPQMVTSFFDLTLSMNSGISFSLLNRFGASNSGVLLGLSLVISAVLFVWTMRAERSLLQFGLSLIVAGALGNACDRYAYGAVVDFLHFHWGPYAFPTFNVADAFVSCGVALVFLDSFFDGESRA